MILRSPETKRTCEITYKPSTEKWHVRCFITKMLTVNFSDMREWPYKEENFEKGIPMLNSYDGLVEAMDAFVEWTK